MTAVGQALKSFGAMLAEVVPNWRSNRLNQNWGFKFEWALVLPFSCFSEQILQGMNAWWPGSPNATLTALPYVGQSRGLIRGEAETAVAYAKRLRNWIGPPPFTGDIWSNMGKTALLAQAIQTYLANNPIVRVIERIYSTSGPTSARWVTANQDGTVSDVVAPWDWDSVSGWTDATTTYPGGVTRGFWSDFWIVVYPTEWPVTGGTGRGQAVTSTAHDAILGLLAQYKGCHTWCRAIIWSYDPAKFTPATPTADGSYGNWGKVVGGVLVAARDTSARYWIPPNG